MSWLDRVDTSGGPSACWPWVGPVTPSGYGRLSDGRYAHVVACESKHGPMPASHVARHLCAERSTSKLGAGRERACCNPAHLEPGTERENAADRVRHGRGKGQRPRPNPDRRLW